MRRLVSLVPSLTELLCHLGLGEQLVGCTSFCVRPPGLQKTLERVGGTKDPQLAKIEALQPSHILANREENRWEDTQLLATLCPTLITFPRSPLEVAEMIHTISGFLALEEAFSSRGQQLASEIEAKLELLKEVSRQKPQEAAKRFLYFIWTRPWMVAGRDTYISQFLELMGYENAVAAAGRYPEIVLNEAKSWGVDITFFSSEPWPFRKRDMVQAKKEWPALPTACWIDGRLMSWYGASTLEALEEALAWVQGAPNQLVREW